MGVDQGLPSPADLPVRDFGGPSSAAGDLVLACSGLVAVFASASCTSIRPRPSCPHAFHSRLAHRSPRARHGLGACRLDARSSVEGLAVGVRSNRDAADCRGQLSVSPLDSPGRGATRGVQLRRRAPEDAHHPVLGSSADRFLARRTRLSASPVPEIRIQDRTGIQGAEELPGAHVSKGPALTLFPDSKRQRAPQRPTRDQEQDVLAIREALDVLGRIVPSHAVMSGQSRPELQLYPPSGILLRVRAAKCGFRLPELSARSGAHVTVRCFVLVDR